MRTRVQQPSIVVLTVHLDQQPADLPQDVATRRARAPFVLAFLGYGVAGAKQTTLMAMAEARSCSSSTTRMRINEPPTAWDSSGPKRA